MATIDIKLSNEIHAEILTDLEAVPSNYPLIIDPVTNSFSDLATLIHYYLYVEDVVGLTNIKLLQNGKNSRFTADSVGSCKLVLVIEDELGNTATDNKIINVG